jgi:hypothetical protein
LGGDFRPRSTHMAGQSGRNKGEPGNKNVITSVEALPSRLQSVPNDRILLKSLSKEDII